MLSGSSDESGIASYLWDFGDGSIGSGVTTTHTYANSGTYPAKVTIQDSSGNIATAIVSVTVAPQSSPTPSASPTIKPAASANPTSKPTPIPTPSLSPTISPTLQPSATTQIPELNIEMVLVLLAASILVLALIFKRSRKQTKSTLAFLSEGPNLSKQIFYNESIRVGSYGIYCIQTLKCRKMDRTILALPSDLKARAIQLYSAPHVGILALQLSIVSFCGCGFSAVTISW